MATRNAIRKIAESSGKSEVEVLMDALEWCGHEQKRVAAKLGVSQSAVSEAMKRLKFVRVIKWQSVSEAS
jgi:Mn-dependent DtxR family transcriptional regulator